MSKYTDRYFNPSHEIYEQYYPATGVSINVHRMTKMGHGCRRIGDIAKSGGNADMEGHENILKTAYAEEQEMNNSHEAIREFRVEVVRDMIERNFSLAAIQQMFGISIRSEINLIYEDLLSS